MKYPREILFVEDCRLFLFVIGSAGEKHCQWRKRTGIQKRNWDGGWKISSMECGIHESGWNKRVQEPGKGAIIVRDESFPDCGGMEEQYSGLLRELAKLHLLDWKVSFRTYLSKREISCGGKKRHANRLKHDSIRIRFRLPEREDYLEVGEGNTGSMAFNQDALIRRLHDLSQNQRERRQTGSGEAAVVLQAGEGAIFFHELFGHALEGDYILQGLSPFSPGSLGQPILPAPLTLSSSDSRDLFFSGLSTDDEGQPRNPLILIENGVLKHFICDSEHGRELDISSQGFCRQEDYTSPPQPRMFGIYLRPGVHPPEEIIAETSEGIFAKEFSSGHVDFQTGSFVFTAQETYRIEGGRIGAPTGTLHFRGSLWEVLREIGMVGNDYKYDKGNSFCRKNGQSVPVRVGQPTVKINRMQILQDFHV